MSNKIAAKPEWLRVNTVGSSNVDRENKIIYGAIVAEAGPFKDLRGEFNRKSLEMIVALMAQKPKGLKARFTHPSLSEDGLGTFLGRYHDPRLDTITRTTQDGKTEQALAVRADLHLSAAAFSSPTHGNLGDYVMTMAETDPTAFGNSLVLQVDQDYRKDQDGSLLQDEETGEDLPPVWYPTALHSLDVVDTGDATNSFLADDSLPDAVVRQATALLEKQFGDCSRAVIEARCSAWLKRYLDNRYGAERLDNYPYTGDGSQAMGEGASPGADNEADPDISDFKVGDRVRFVQEHHQHYMGMQRCGVIQETSTGPLKIPGTSIVRQGSLSEPIALVKESSGRKGKQLSYHLTPYSKLQYMASDEEDSPDEGNVNKGNESPARDGMDGVGGSPAGLSAEDECLLLDIELRSREAETLGANLTHDSKTADKELPWGSVDKGKLPRVAFADKGEADSKSTWKFPHHFVEGGKLNSETGVYESGTLYLHKAGLDAAWSAAQGGRSGKKASAAVIAHLQAHRRALGLDKDDQ